MGLHTLVLICTTPTLLLIGFFRFATELFFRILAVGCAIIVLIALAWGVYTYVLH
jgi:hypothetical protein